MRKYKNVFLSCGMLLTACFGLNVCNMSSNDDDLLLCQDERNADVSDLDKAASNPAEKGNT